jgi:ABC-type glycerol-3-phosphate transport system substrate-binding protein
MTRIVAPVSADHNGRGETLREKMRVIVVALLLMSHAAWSAAFDPALVDGARREGSITWYTGLIVNQAARPLAAAFEARFPGVKVSYAETTLKFTNDARAGHTAADVFEVTSAIRTLQDAPRIRRAPLSASRRSTRTRMAIGPCPTCIS